jgi:hypothetical protein
MVERIIFWLWHKRFFVLRNGWGAPRSASCSSLQTRSWLCFTAEADHPTWKTFSIFSK